MMIKKFIYCLLLTALAGVSQVSVGQQVTKPKQPSAEQLHRQLNVERPRGQATIPAQPNAEYLRERLAFKVPLVWNVQSLDIETTHNIGSAREPVYKQRFEAQISLKENLYEPVEEDVYESAALRDRKRIVKTVANAGEGRKLLGEATSVYLNGQYNVFFELEKKPLGMGRPLKEFDGEVLVQGSPEELKYTAERQQKIHAEHLSHEEEEATEHKKAEEKARKMAVEEARKRAAEADKARKGGQ
jgi:hypothetical protein